MKAPGARKKKLLLVVVLASLAGLGGCVALLFQDEPPPDDSDLLLVRREVPAEQNGFLAIDFTSDDVYWPDDDERLSVESADFDVDAAREVVEKNAAVLAKLDECLRRPEFQGGEDYDQVPYLLAWRSLAFLASCRSVLLCETGRPAEGLRAAVQLMEFGKRGQEAQGPVITYLVSVAVQSIAAGTARRSLRYPELQADAIRPLLEDVVRLRPSATAFRESLLQDWRVPSSQRVSWALLTRALL